MLQTIFFFQLEDVMEKETYKKAKEILEKFDPARFKEIEVIVLFMKKLELRSRCIKVKIFVAEKQEKIF